MSCVGEKTFPKRDEQMVLKSLKKEYEIRDFT